jgi:hypothetical protein
MKPNTQQASTGRARFNRLRWWWLRRMGWPGLAALLLVLVAGGLEWGVRPAIARQNAQLLHEHVARLDAAARLRASAANVGQRDPRDQLRDSLPPVSQRGESVAALLRLLEVAQLSADRAEYTAEEMEPGLVRLRITVPVQGGYGATRELIASLLNELPNAALDRVELARPAAGANKLSGQLYLSLFFRREAS